MGCSWSFWLAQRAHVHLSLMATGWSASQVFVQGRPDPDIVTQVGLTPYCNNGNIIGSTRELVAHYSSQIVNALHSHGFGVHEITEPLSYVESLRVVVDDRRHRVSPSSKRLHGVMRACEYLSYRPWVSGKQLEHCIGHITFLCLLNR